MATYLVTQATGVQGRAVVKYLLEAGVKVHAIVRDLTKVPEILESPGVTLFQGESKNFDDIYKAAQGCKGAYLNTYPIPGLEVLQAQTIVDASKKAGIEIIVAATTSGTDNKALWDTDKVKELGLHEYYVSKTAIEDAVRAGGFKSYTILRPAILLQDFLVPNSYANFPGLPTRGVLDHAFNETTKAPYSDADDVGKYTAAALLNPDKFNGQEINLSNELFTIEEAGAILAKVSGRAVPVKKRTDEEVEEAKVTIPGQKFQLLANFSDIGTAPLKTEETQAKFGIPFTSLEAGLQRERVQLLESLPH